MQTYLCFGSWKLRHSEPLEPDERGLTLYPWPRAARPRGATAEVRLAPNPGAAVDDAPELTPDGTTRRTAGDAYPDLLDALPLAIVDTAGDGYRITHALMRVEDHLAQFFRIDPVDTSQRELWRAIAEIYAAHHLTLSNHECYYIKDRPDIELEQKLMLGTSFAYTDLTAAFYTALDEGSIPGFSPQLGDEIQFWSYDNHLFELAPDGPDRGYVSVIEYCKKKTAWDQPMVMFKKKLYDRDSLERWERNYENQWVESGYQAALESFFNYRLNKLPAWRRTRCDVACESDGGHVYMVNFDTCQVHGDGSPRGCLQQCEIEYLKTRGVPRTDAVKTDFERLVAAVEAFLEEHGYAPRRSHFSKLTFLKEYLEASTDEPSTGH